MTCPETSARLHGIRKEERPRNFVRTGRDRNERTIDSADLHVPAREEPLSSMARALLGILDFASSPKAD